MFGKLFNILKKEQTNTADLSPVTFNTPGTYVPKYGKHKVTVTAKGTDGGYTAGNYVPASTYSYYNPGNQYSYDNGYSYTVYSPAYSYNAIGYASNAASYTPGTYTPGNTYSYTNPGTYAPGYYTYYVVYSYYPGNTVAAYNPSSLSYATDPGADYYSYAYYVPGNLYYYTNPATTYYQSITVPSYTPNYIPGNTSYASNPGTTNPAAYTPGNTYSYVYVVNVPASTNYAYQPGNTSYAYNAPSLAYASNPAYTNSPVAYTGTEVDILNIVAPGGAGTTAPTTNLTTKDSPYGQLSSVTVPSGGYASITFSL